MALRSGRKGAWLASDDYTGLTRYASELHRDYWGNYTKKPLKRNLQEIASPLNDPEPVPLFRGGKYEPTVPADFALSPLYIGNTTQKTRPSLAGDVLGYDVLLSDLGIGDMEIGTTFFVR